MKARPRFVERRVASELTRIYRELGMSKVERIPVLGRTGPDITINELRLAVDVKSRLSVPKLYRISEPTIFKGAEDSLGTRLGDTNFLRVPDANIKEQSSVVVEAWLEKMREWDREFIGAIILHWPKTPIKHAVLLINTDDWRILSERSSSFRRISSEYELTSK